MEIKNLLHILEQYTEEPDAFETQSEREMERELMAQIDQDFIKQEKEQDKYRLQLSCILNEISKKIPITVYEKGKKFEIHFPYEDIYNRFMAQYKNYDRILMCLDDKHYWNRNAYFNQITNYLGDRYITLYSK